MFDSKWTFSSIGALRIFTFVVAAHVVALALFLVTFLAEMSIAPAEPLCYRATEFAFELYKVLSVCFAIGVTRANGLSGTGPTD